MTPATPDRKPMLTKIQKLTTGPSRRRARRGGCRRSRRSGGRRRSASRPARTRIRTARMISTIGRPRAWASCQAKYMTTAPTSTTRRRTAGRTRPAAGRDAGDARAELPDRVADAAIAPMSRVNASKPVAAEQPVEEAAGDLAVLGGERRERDVVEHLQREAAEEQHAGEGHDERRDADVGDPEPCQARPGCRRPARRRCRPTTACPAG